MKYTIHSVWDYIDFFADNDTEAKNKAKRIAKFNYSWQLYNDAGYEIYYFEKT